MPLIFLTLLTSCSPEQRCYRDEDCDGIKICNAVGECQYKCLKKEDCGTGFLCEKHECVLDPNYDPGGGGGGTVVKRFVCPDGMVSIEDTYCIDPYEASKPDATATSEGKDESHAVSKAGVRPWRIGDNNAGAQAACEAAGKRLCTATEWEFSCHGVNNTVYGYGDTYDPAICNGIDTFGNPGFKIMPTGSFPDCTNGWGVYDMSGNLWEHTAGGNAKTVRGGAYNCVDSRGNHRCSYVPMTWTPLALGFRCCADGEIIEETIPDDDSGEPQASLMPRSEDQKKDERDGDFFTQTDIWKLFAQADGQTDVMTDASLNMYDAESSDDDILDALSTIAPIEDDELVIPETETESQFYADDVFEDAAPSGPCIPPEESLAQAFSLWNDDDQRAEAIHILKTARACHPQNAEVLRMLGVTYAKQGNTAWALRILVPYLHAHPEDCEAIAWTAWIQSQAAMLQESEETLSKAGNCGDRKLNARLKLVGVFNDMSAEDTKQAQKEIQAVQKEDELFSSDAEAALSMSRTLGIAPDPNFSWSAELGIGYASNAVSGSPNDPTLIEKTLASGLLDGDLRLTLDPVKNYWLHPIAEGKLNGRLLFSKDTMDSSYLDLSLRIGLTAISKNAKFGLWYSPESLIMHGGDRYDDGPLLFYTGHRLELDIEVYKWLYLFAGYGRRLFRQQVRTRHELDIGAGGHHTLVQGLGLTWGATYRQWISEGKMYDLYGTNLTIALDYRLSADWIFKLSGAFAYDAYPDSKGYFTELDSRKETSLKGTLQAWSPAFAGVRFGAQFKASRRWSSADAYDFVDYRGLLSIKWTGDLYFYTPSKRDNDPYALPWDIETDRASERIRDIIRQDEDMQRSSSCLQN